MEEVLLCCVSGLVLLGVIIGIALFSVYNKFRNNNREQISDIKDESGKTPKLTLIESGQKSNPNIIETLLTTIGVWLGLPSICGTSQKLLEDFLAFGTFSSNMTNAIKLGADALLLILLIIGLIFFVFIAIAGWSTGAIWKNFISPWLPSWIKGFFKKKEKKMESASAKLNNVEEIKESKDGNLTSKSGDQNTAENDTKPI